MKLPKITNKEQTILELLYRYRFLNRIQIQALMKHKDKKTINVWLKDLREKHYIEWIYDADDFAEKTKPAIYYMGINGVRFLKWTDEYQVEELRKRYREDTRSQTFIDRCIQLANCCIELKAKCIGIVDYSFVTQSDYIDEESKYHFLAENELVQPHICFTKHETNNEEDITTHYLLEIFDATFPRYRIKKRLKDYVEFLSNGEWESETGDDEPPVVLLVCPRLTDLIYAKRRTRGLIAELWDETKPHIRFATADQLKTHGVTGQIWEEA